MTRDVEAERQWWENLMTVAAAARQAQRAKSRRRQEIADAGLTIALGVVMVALVCCTLGATAMLLGYRLFT